MVSPARPAAQGSAAEVWAEVEAAAAAEGCTLALLAHPVAPVQLAAHALLEQLAQQVRVLGANMV